MSEGGAQIPAVGGVCLYKGCIVFPDERVKGMNLAYKCSCPLCGDALFSLRIWVGGAKVRSLSSWKRGVVAVPLRERRAEVP